MRAVVQRVASARVTVQQEVVGEIGAGLVALVGVHQQDGPADAAWLVDKLTHLRVFEDSAGKMNHSLLETAGAALVISQFTLYGDARKGRRPSFAAAAGPDIAAPLVQQVADGLRAAGIRTATGRFGAHMRVALENDGPVTILLDSPRQVAPEAAG